MIFALSLLGFVVLHLALWVVLCGFIGAIADLVGSWDWDWTTEFWLIPCSIS